MCIVVTCIAFLFIGSAILAIIAGGLAHLGKAAELFNMAYPPEVMRFLGFEPTSS